MITQDIFAVNKPKGLTSHDVVNIIRKKTSTKKVGHGGTLDPLASGVLVIAVGRQSTKKLHQIIEAEKEYVATVEFGQFSQTDDAQGDKTKIEVKTKPTSAQIKQAMFEFSGKFLQTPPIYSAKKVAGQTAYRLARKGRVVELKPKLVELKEFEIISYRWPKLKIRLVTGSGFYVRALARDLGKVLKTGGYLADLERTRVCQFTTNNCVALDEFTN